MGEPLGEDATRREVGGKIIYGGGGDSTPEKQTTVVDIPDWAKPYAKESLGKASALTNTPYQTYGGERIAQFTPMQKQAFGRAEGQQVAEQIGAGSGLAGTAGLMGLTGGYQPGQFGSQMSQYMSPYMDAVIQRQMDSAQRQADIASTQRGAQAVRAGAFGGSRQAIENAEAARALASQKGQIQETGLQSAYDRATDMYGREQALAEQSRQAGLSTALGAAGQLGQLGQQQFGQQMDITGQQAQFGGQQRQATQDILSQQYQDFLNQQRAPYDQLSFMSSLIRGTPMGQTTTQYQPPPSTTSQLIGLGTAAAGAYGAYKGAAGGSVPSYASGGKLNLEGTFEVADGGGGLGGGSMFNNMQQGGIGGAQMPQQPMLFRAEPAVMPQGGNYAAGGIANLKNQPEMAAAARGMDDQQVAKTAGMEGIAGLTAGDEQRRRSELRMAAEGQKAPASMTKITSTLSQMSDAELQQYAKLNKSDPYTMALVVSEANRRKEGGMPTQKAPTVVEQQIAGMALPEEMGIAQLPTGNMEFAGGGIIAFAQGDEVLSTEEQLERQRAEDRARIKSAFESGLISAEEFGRALADIGTLPVRGVAGALDTAVIRPLRAAGADIGYMSPYLVPDGVDPASMTPFSDQMRSRTQDNSGIAALKASSEDAPRGRGVGFTDPRLSQSGVDQSVAALRAAETQRKDVAETGTGEKKQPGPPGIPSGLGYLQQLQAERDRQIAAQAEIDRLRAADVATTRGELSEEEKLAREFGAEREKRLKTQEEKLAGSEKQNFNMTLIEAGLAMMAGDSPNAFKNLAEGAARGLKGYQGRLQTLQDSREKLDESMARLAEIREEKLSAVGARKRELNVMERSIMTESKAAQEKIASAFAGDKIKFTKDQADKASARAFDIYKLKQRDVTGSRTDAANLRVALSGQINALQRKRDQGEGLSEDETQELAQLQREFSGLTRMLSDRLGLQGSGTVGGSSTLPAGFKLD